MKTPTSQTFNRGSNTAAGGRPESHPALDRPCVRVLLAVFCCLVALIAMPGHDAMAQSTAPQSNVPQTTVPRSTVPADDADWSMVAANPGRTSWTPHEVRGDLAVEWYRPIEPYIHAKIQPIATGGLIYVATARGLYAFDAASGDQSWVYPTAAPLGNAPTVATVDGRRVLYVGGYDRKIHALDAGNGVPPAGYQAHVAGAGFETNPLVIDEVIYAGNRDGYFYALNASTGALRWRYAVGSPIHQSAAFHDDVLYFAADNGRAYALDAADGSLLWASTPLPGSGFYTYWPVVYTDQSSGVDYVVFTGGENYRFRRMNLVVEESDTVYAGLPDSELIGPTSTGVDGDWVDGTVAVDVSILAQYLEDSPNRRTVFVLNAATGQEFTFDADGDGKPEYAPFNWAGVTHSGSKYPPLVNGIDGVYYQATGYIAPGWISRADPAGWKFGTQFISLVESDGFGHASDEPLAYASGGRLIYWSLCCDRESGAMDVTIPFGQEERTWDYYGYNLANNQLAPGYQQMYDTGDTADYNNPNGWQVYSGAGQSQNGVYGKHGTAQSPPIPYQGRVYMLRGNALIAFSPTGTDPQTPLPTALTEPAQPDQATLSRSDVTALLEAEVQKMLAAEPLRPGYHDAGFYDLYGNGGFTDARTFGELFDYFHNPADTVHTLLLAYPHLSPALRTEVKSYLQSNYGPDAPFDFTNFVHVGWGNGAAREDTAVPAEIQAGWGEPYTSPLEPSTQPVCGWCGYWEYYPPASFYAAWQYAAIIGDGEAAFARTLFDRVAPKLETPPADDVLLAKPYWLNQYIAGYFGYLSLQTMAGYAEDPAVRATHDRLLALRVDGFEQDSPWPRLGADSPDWELAYQNALAVARNFMFLTPELAEHLGAQLPQEIDAALAEYVDVAPYWFVSKFDVTYGEGSLHHLYDAPALFQAKAYVRHEPFQELARWIDVPAFARGDLFFIQNLAAALAAPDAPPVSGFTFAVRPSTHVVAPGGMAEFEAVIVHDVGFTDMVMVQIGNNVPPQLSVEIVPPVAFAPPGGTTVVTVTDLSGADVVPDASIYFVRVTATGGTVVHAADLRLVVAPHRVYLPVVQRTSGVVR